MVENYEVKFKPEDFELETQTEFVNLMDNFKLNKAIDLIWQKIKSIDGKIQKEEPFKVAKEDLSKAQEMVGEYLIGLWGIANLLEIFIPETTKKIQDLIKENKSPQTPLFLRK